MMIPIHSPRKVDPEEQIRDLEDDPMTRLIWDLIPKVGNQLSKLHHLLTTQQTQQSEPIHEPVTEC
jgi:hypothetical protein